MQAIKMIPKGFEQLEKVGVSFALEAENALSTFGRNTVYYTWYNSFSCTPTGKRVRPQAKWVTYPEGIPNDEAPIWSALPTDETILPYVKEACDKVGIKVQEYDYCIFRIDRR